MAKVERVTVQRRPREPGELASRTWAIRNMCLECAGWNAAEVRRCSNPECWLWPWRLGPGSGLKHIKEELEG